MSTKARRRILNDYRKLQADPPPGVFAAPCENNIMCWHAVIIAPNDTPFEDGVFRLRMEFTEQYPNSPPQVTFLTKIFHPNVYNNGSICLDVLQNMWSPTYDIGAVLTSIQSLLGDPNPNSPANTVAAELYMENRREYERRVRVIVEDSWLHVDIDTNETLTTSA